MSDKVKVTVGVCIKNEEASIEKALESIFQQDFPHNSMELIIVDGYSKDKTMRIVKKALQKTDFKYNVIYDNHGLGSARQIVVEEASGDYIVWVDGDVRLSKDYIRQQVDFMERHRKVGIAGGKYALLEGNLAFFLENVAYVVDSFKSAGKPHPKLPGSEGSIYRTEAVKQVGGFDKNIKGACEDIEVAYKMKEIGWSLVTNNAVFEESCRSTWRGLWNQYCWWGKGGHYLFHENRRINPVYEMIPPAGLLAGLLRTSTAYSITHKKRVFLLPFHYTFKRIAWCCGFLEAHLNGYGHASRPHFALDI
jgi:glycosyltransferase involved in cell wall biosynthesis